MWDLIVAASAAEVLEVSYSTGLPEAIDLHCSTQGVQTLLTSWTQLESVQRPAAASVGSTMS